MLERLYVFRHFTLRKFAILGLWSPYKIIVRLVVLCVSDGQKHFVVVGLKNIKFTYLNCKNLHISIRCQDSSEFACPCHAVGIVAFLRISVPEICAQFGPAGDE